MSMRPYGINMFGVSMNDLKFKDFKELVEVDAVKKWLDECGLDEDDFVLDDYIWEVVFEEDCERGVELPNGKFVYVGIDSTEDATYIGFYAGYPWDDSTRGIEKEDVQDAVWQLFKDVVIMSKEELVKQMDEISTCCWG